LTLPVGTYQVTLQGPPPDLESRVVTIQILAEGTTAPAPERFRTMTLEEYFEQYLASATAEADGGAIATPAAGTESATSLVPAGPAPATAAPTAPPQGAAQ
jgi:hypothetical protein